MAEPSELDVSAELADVELMLLGGPRTYTRAEVAERTGLSPDFDYQIWRALGFSEVGDDEALFTDGDIEALMAIVTLQERGLADEHTIISTARFLGRTMSRLAQIEVDLISAKVLASGQTDEQRAEALMELIRQAKHTLPAAERLFVHAWRRHLAAALGRGLQPAGPGGTTLELTVGFADLEGYTSLTRTLDDDELMALVDGFERRASEVVTRYSGRVIKTVGDEILFANPDLVACAETALALADLGGTEGLPRIKVGMAAGTVLSWLGDVYGRVVNVAARLTSLARPGTVLVDKVAAERLAQHDGYKLDALRPRRVRGYQHLQPARLQRRA